MTGIMMSGHNSWKVSKILNVGNDRIIVASVTSLVYNWVKARPYKGVLCGVFLQQLLQLLGWIQTNNVIIIGLMKTDKKCD